VKGHKPISSLAILFLFLVVSGCGNATIGGEKIAYISATENSQYAKTFNDLHLGILYDYNLKLPEADKSWVTLWVEGYKNGKKTVPFRLTELSYGLNPNQVDEGPMGFGIINPQHENVSFFLYSSAASIPPLEVENILNSEGVGASHWGIAIGQEEVGLEPGETKVLGVYRQAGNSIRTYDYQDMNQITQMINEDITVLLLKIKVERKD